MVEKPEPKIVSEMLGLLAHDLRNPLSALHSNIGFLISALNAESRDIKEAVFDAALSCEGLTNLIDALETLAFTLADAPSLQQSRFCVEAVLQEQMMKNQPVAESHEVGLVIVGRLPSIPVLAHRDMLSRAVGAILRNGIQHAPHRSEVQVELRQQDGRALILVSDEGVKLDPSTLEEAVSAEGQISSKSTAGGRYGRGLGLFCAHVCSEVAGGRLEIREEDQDHNCFQVSVPLADI